MRNFESSYLSFIISSKQFDGVLLFKIKRRFLSPVVNLYALFICLICFIILTLSQRLSQTTKNVIILLQLIFPALYISTSKFFKLQSFEKKFSKLTSNLNFHLSIINDGLFLVIELIQKRLYRFNLMYCRKSKNIYQVFYQGLLFTANLTR